MANAWPTSAARAIAVSRAARLTSFPEVVHRATPTATCPASRCPAPSPGVPCCSRRCVTRSWRPPKTPRAETVDLPGLIRRAPVSQQAVPFPYLTEAGAGAEFGEDGGFAGGAVGDGARWSARYWLSRGGPRTRRVARDLDVVAAPPGAAVADQLGLEQAVECLGEGVVVRISPRSDRDDRIGPFEALGGADRSILNSGIGVMDQTGRIAARVTPSPATGRRSA